MKNILYTLVLQKHFRIAKMKISLFLIILIQTSLLANFVATITATRGEVKILRQKNLLLAHPADKLYTKDNVITKDNAKAQIIFTDETIITIGKNSNFSIEKYLFEDNNEPIVNFKMLQGAMRTITGKIGKIAPQKFSVTTKSATIGIRGTNFTIVINDLGYFQAYCTFGEIQASTNKEKYSIKQGFYITIGKEIQPKIQKFTSKDLQKMRNKNFTVINKNLSKELSTESIKLTAKDNSAQLDLITNNNIEEMVNTIDENTKDTMFNAQTLDSVIAGYSFDQWVIYFGNYTTYENRSSSLPQNGDVKAEINFGQDIAKLKIGSFENADPTVTYIFNNINSNTLTGVQENNQIGSATILFYGPTGNTINGNFNYAEKDKITAKGNYTATAIKPLQ